LSSRGEAESQALNLASFQSDAEALTLCNGFVTLAPFHMRNSSLAKSGVAARVLLVDDNRDGLAARKSLLEEQGFIAVTAVNGEEAFEALSKMTFDLMVTDFKMPKMNGIELIRCVRPLHPALRIIMLSGFVEALGLDEKSTGADIVIAKGPNEISHLLRSVARLLARNVARRPPGSQKDPRSRLKTRSKSV
jgi:CheY-like chemotaxis protein